MVSDFMAWNTDQTGDWKPERNWPPASPPKTQAAYVLICMKCCPSYYLYCTIRTRNPEQLIRGIFYLLAFFYAEKVTKEQGVKKISCDFLDFVFGPQSLLSLNDLA